jgi:hypothetical protein
MSEAIEPQYTDDSKGWAQRWAVELKGSHDASKEWRADGLEAVHRFRDEKRKATDSPERRWNLFFAGVSTQLALLFGQVPKVSVTRRYEDAADDVARVTGTMLERLLNADLDADDPFTLALGQALQDRLLPGLGTARVRYDVEMEEVAPPPLGEPEGVPGAAAPVVERKVPGTEEAEVEYVHWQDLRWSAGARHWKEVMWVAFRVLMSRQQLEERFGEEVGGRVPLNARQHDRDNHGREQASPWDRAEVWEIWDKGTKCVFWYSEGHASTLDKVEDPLGLEGFFPCPRPMAANLTTDRFLPRPDYCLARDLYDQIDTLQTRLGLLEEALRVVGAYDKQFTGLERMLSGAAENELIPVDKWALLSEKGGLRGVVDWFPLEQVANAITSLESRQDRLKAQLYEVTGMSDILRGQGQGPGVTATEQGLKARFASARLQAVQEDFARFASDVARLRAEVIAKHFEPASILAQANMTRTPDARLTAAAVELLKSPELPYRVQVRPEALALSDFSQLRSERFEVLSSVSTFMGAVAPLVQSMPAATQPLLALLQWTLSAVRGAAEVEGIFDAAIARAQNVPPPGAGQQPQAPDPKLLTVQAKAQGDAALMDKELQGDLIRLQAEVQADAMREQNQREQNVQEAKEKSLVAAAARNTLSQGGMP